MKPMHPSFGRRNALRGSGVDQPALLRAFGRRMQKPDADVSLPCSPAPEVVTFSAFARLRLSGIYRDLLNLYHEPEGSRDLPIFQLHDDRVFELLIGHHASVRIDEGSGRYILRIESRHGATITVETGSEDVLVDHIIGHLALDRGRHLSILTHGMVSTLVGRSISDIERSLILATLRRCNFNRTHAAEMLGISLRTIRNKLRSYRQDAETSPASGASPPIDNKTAGSPRSKDVGTNSCGGHR